MPLRWRLRARALRQPQGPSVGAAGREGPAQPALRRPADPALGRRRRGARPGSLEAVRRSQRSGARSGPRRTGRPRYLLTLTVQQGLAAARGARHSSCSGSGATSVAPPCPGRQRPARRRAVARRARVRPELPAPRNARTDRRCSARTRRTATTSTSTGTQYGLVVEIDGIHHAWAQNIVGDALRQNRWSSRATVVLRLPLLGLRLQPDDFFDQIDEALIAGAGRPPPEVRRPTTSYESRSSTTTIRMTLRRVPQSNSSLSQDSLRFFLVALPLGLAECAGGGVTRGGGRLGLGGRVGPGAPLLGCCPLDDLVELAAVEPDAAALRAVVDLDPAALAHHQGGSVGRALHGCPPLWGSTSTNGQVCRFVPGPRDNAPGTVRARRNATETRRRTEMTTHVTTRNPVRADLDTTGGTHRGRHERADPPTRRRRGWALGGVAAGVLGIGTMVSSSMINAIYDKSIALDEDAILAKLADQSMQIIMFQVVASLTALALVVFAAGLHRRLAARLDDSIVPMVASAGLIGTAVVTVLGTGLNTEFAVGHRGSRAGRQRGDVQPLDRHHPVVLAARRALRASRLLGLAPGRRTALDGDHQPGARRPDGRQRRRCRSSTWRSSRPPSGCWSSRSASSLATSVPAGPETSATDTAGCADEQAGVRRARAHRRTPAVPVAHRRPARGRRPRRRRHARAPGRASTSPREPGGRSRPWAWSSASAAASSSGSTPASGSAGCSAASACSGGSTGWRSRGCATASAPTRRWPASARPCGSSTASARSSP